MLHKQQVLKLDLVSCLGLDKFHPGNSKLSYTSLNPFYSTAQRIGVALNYSHSLRFEGLVWRRSRQWFKP